MITKYLIWQIIVNIWQTKYKLILDPWPFVNILGVFKNVDVSKHKYLSLLLAPSRKMPFMFKHVTFQVQTLI